MRLTSRRLLRACLLSIPFVVFLLGALLYSHDMLDDPYITYRYAHNLARGHGLVWNVGEAPVEGYTNFLWAIIHAPFIAIGVSPLLVSRVISTLAGLTLIACLLSPLNQLVRSNAWRLVVATLVALCPVLHFYGQSGLETLAFTALLCIGAMLWAASQSQPDRDIWLACASACFGLAILTRPEAMLVFALTALFEWRMARKNATRRRDFLCLIVPFLALWLPYFLWRWHFYGYLFPNTYYAKHSGNHFDNLPLGLTYVGKAFTMYFAVPAALIAGVVMRGDVPANEPASDKSRMAWPLLAIAGAYALSIAWMGGDDTDAFPSIRLLAPVLPLIWLALAAVCEDATARGSIRRQQGAALLVVSLLALAWRGDGMMLFNWANRNVEGVRDPRVLWRAMTDKARHLNRETPGELSLYLLKTTTPQSLIAVPWAGRVPYYTDRPTIDTLGLNDLHIAHLERKQSGIDVKMDPEYVLARRPEWIFVNVEACYWQGTCSFRAASGWKNGDWHFIELLRHSRDYVFVPEAPTSRCAFRLRR